MTKQFAGRPAYPPPQYLWQLADKFLGFRKTEVTEHVQRHQFGHDRESEYKDMHMFTVVGHR